MITGPTLADRHLVGSVPGIFSCDLAVHIDAKRAPGRLRNSEEGGRRRQPSVRTGPIRLKRSVWRDTPGR